MYFWFRVCLWFKKVMCLVKFVWFWRGWERVFGKVGKLDFGNGIWKQNWNWINKYE